MTVEAIVNQALDLIGYKRHVGSVWDGSPAARVALNAYAETRDEVLALRPWPFARARIDLSPDAAVPHAPWSYRFTRPTEAITILDVVLQGSAPALSAEVVPYYWQEDGEGNTRT